MQQTTEDDESVNSMDTTESTKLREIDVTNLSDEAKLNIECDKLAGDVTEYAKNNPHRTSYRCHMRDQRQC